MRSTLLRLASRLAVVAVLAAMAVPVLGCSPEPEKGNEPAAAPAPTAPPPRPNFVLVVVDTLRLDRLHFAGYEEKNTPSFDALRAESTPFPAEMADLKALLSEAGVSLSHSEAASETVPEL